jgi:hypothetical protein
VVSLRQQVAEIPLGLVQVEHQRERDVVHLAPDRYA